LIVYGLLFDPDSELPTIAKGDGVLHIMATIFSSIPIYGKLTDAKLRALAFPFGSYVADMITFTDFQLKIPTLLVHHVVSCVGLFFPVYFEGLCVWLTLMSSAAEFFNPFWYTHWVLVSLGLFSKTLVKPFFWVNGIIITLSYIFFRFCYQAPIMVASVFALFASSVHLAQTIFITTLLLIYLLLSADNLIKLCKSLYRVFFGLYEHGTGNVGNGNSSTKNGSAHAPSKGSARTAKSSKSKIKLS
jgi:hypothetical protein